MKQIMSICLALGLCFAFASSTNAAREYGSVTAPTGLAVAVADGQVCFDWDDVEGATKYSVDVDVEFDSDGNGVADMTIEFSFGTSNYNEDMGLSEMCVPLDEFVYDVDGDGILDPIYGPATAKVKGLAPGRGQGRQNNAFSAGFDFNL
jgi:hypothetical protein